MIAPPPTADVYCVMIRWPAMESVPVPCEYATIPGSPLVVGMLDQYAHGRLGLQIGLSWLIVAVASCGLMESISKVPALSTESRRVITTVSFTALRVSVSTSWNASLPLSFG